MTTTALSMTTATDHPLSGLLLSVDDARQITGGLSITSKMPCASYSLPASACGVGSRMRDAGRAAIAARPSARPSQPKAIADGLQLSPCTGCYARKGNYVRPNVANVLQRRLDSITDPRWVDAMVVLIADDGRDWFRWHDSGDLQSVDHLANIAEVARQLPAVAFWLPTQERRVVRDYTSTHGPLPSNLTVRYSAPLMNHRPDPRQTASYVVTDGTVPADVHACPAPSQGGECGSCRACWDTTVPTVAYRAH